MNLTDMRARLQRLEKLALGLATEASLWKECDVAGRLDVLSCFAKQFGEQRRGGSEIEPHDLRIRATSLQYA